MKTKITTHQNAVVLKAKNKRINIISENKSGIKINRIEVKSLTSECGDEKGAISINSKNGKIKYSGIGFTDEALIYLHYALTHYLKNILNK